MSYVFHDCEAAVNVQHCYSYFTSPCKQNCKEVCPCKLWGVLNMQDETVPGGVAKAVPWNSHVGICWLVEIIYHFFETIYATDSATSYALGNTVFTLNFLSLLGKFHDHHLNYLNDYDKERSKSERTSMIHISKPKPKSNVSLSCLVFIWVKVVSRSGYHGNKAWLRFDKCDNP